MTDQAKKRKHDDAQWGIDYYCGALGAMFREIDEATELVRQQQTRVNMMRGRAKQFKMLIEQHFEERLTMDDDGEFQHTKDA